MKTDFLTAIGRGGESAVRGWLILVIVLLMCGTGASAAGITFDSGLSTGVVLQRERPIPVSGMAAPGAAVTVSLGAARSEGHAGEDGRWVVTFPEMAAGGPHALTASAGADAVTIDDVWVGDVWVASGQSNMQMGLAEMIGGREMMAELGRLPALRVLEVPRRGAERPQAEMTAAWQRPSPEVLGRFSAVAGSFAAHLRHDPALAGVPLGLINSSFGGTSIEAWLPDDALTGISADQRSGSMFGIPPGALFNAMIHPLFARPVRGVLWYQGEANAGQPGVYRQLLVSLIERWRAGWRQADLPVLVVQLPAFEGRMGGLDFGWVRESQDAACREVAGAWSVVTYDTTDGFDLHPKEKEEIGRRLALVARREVYGLEVSAHGPRVRMVEASGPQLKVLFDQDVRTASGRPPRGFAVAADDGEFHFADAVIDGATVVLQAAAVPRPQRVRYAWGGLTDADLSGRDGLPAFAFRNDKRPPDSLVFQPLPGLRRIETPRYQLETGSGGRVASLIVDGRQFLSNDPGGGTAVPGGFGFRSLGLTTVPGPRRITLSDGGVTLEVACAENDMSWTLINHGEEPVDLHITLAAAVTARAEGSVAHLSREGVSMKIHGITRLEGQRIIATAPARGAAPLRLVLEAH